MSRGLRSLLVCLALPATACSGGGKGDGGPAGCVAGATEACACPEGLDGVQNCQPGGSWGACVCPDAGNDGGPAVLDGGCRTDSDCGGAASGTPRCDTDAGLCVECLGPADCSYDFPGCSQGFCGSCLSEADCPSGLTCDTTANACLCNSNAGCGGDAPLCISAAGGGSCGCNANQDCGKGEVCDTINFAFGACVPSCLSDGGACDPSGANPDCDKTSGICLQSLSNAECVDAGFGRLCSPTLGCVDCLTDQDCADTPATPYCETVCVGCRDWQDCPADKAGCDTSTQTCGSCTFNTDCPDGYGCADAGTCIVICSTWLDAGSTPCAQCQADFDCPGTTTCNVDAGKCH